jgi:hypothetical protein
MLPEEPAMEKARIPQPSDSSPDRRKDRSSSRNISQAKSKFTSASTSALVKESPEADLSKSKIKNQPEVSNSPSNMYTSLSSRKDYKFSSSNGNLLGNSQTENAKKVLKTEVSVVKN